jgi:peptidoglycan hydrolase-like protein with peptidoglycan-binding domain
MRTVTLPGTGSAGTNRLRRRRFVVIAVAALAIIASAGGLLISMRIKSPAQLAAQTAPPAATQLTVPVTRQVITSTVLAQAVVKAPAEVAQLSGANGGGGGNGALPVVTKIFFPEGSTPVPGSVIVEVAGRPLFVFQGTVPAYRNMTEGESGTDVAQLQAGLQSLGYSTGGDASGVFGPGTASAVAAYYTALGYPVPTAPGTPKASGKGKTARPPMVPLSEILFVPRFPARVVKVAGPVGQEASGSLVTLSMGHPGLAGQLAPSDAALVKPGMAVSISDQTTGLTRRGHIGSVGKRTQTKNSISGGVYLPMKIIPDSPLPASLVGHDVSLTITSAHSAGRVLAVPEAAVFARPDGRLYVTKVTGNRSVQVPVHVEVTGNGMVGISPAGRGTLAPGDRVVTGTGYARHLP